MSQFCLQLQDRSMQQECEHKPCTHNGELKPCLSLLRLPLLQDWFVRMLPAVEDPSRRGIVVLVVVELNELLLLI